MPKTPQKLLSPEVRPVNNNNTLVNAVANKGIIDQAMKNAAEKALSTVGTEKYTCYLCSQLKSRDKFLPSTDRRSLSRITRICEDCAKKIAEDCYDGGVPKQPTPESVYEACRYLDYPWIRSIYDTAVQRYSLGECTSIEEERYGVWEYYLVLLKQEKLSDSGGLLFKDSEPLNIQLPSLPEGVNTQTGSYSKDSFQQEASFSEEYAQEEYEQNQRDVIRMVGYDPFAYYPIIDDKPRLYAQLISFIDEETRQDGMKMGAVIQIVKKLNQAEKLNMQIDFLVNDLSQAGQHAKMVDLLASSSKKLMDVAKDLAKDNGISVNFNNNKSVGASTLSGKIKKLTEIGLRSAKINTFDIGTCEGMRQVAEISEAARHKRIGYDENIASEIKDIKVELVEQMTKERDEAKEMARKLLLENKDLKQYLSAKGLMTDDGKGVE